MSIDMQIKGVDDLNKALQQLPGNIARKVLRNATQTAANVIVKEAKSKAPFESVKKNIRRKKTGGGNNFVKISIYVAKRAFYWSFFELGTKHIGPKPFLRPALDEKKDATIKKLGERLWIGIKKEAAKLRK